MIFSKLLQLGLTMSKYVLNSMSGQTVTYYNILMEAIVNRRKVFFVKKNGGVVLSFYKPKKFFFGKKRGTSEQNKSQISLLRLPGCLRRSFHFSLLDTSMKIFLYYFVLRTWKEYISRFYLTCKRSI